MRSLRWIGATLVLCLGLGLAASGCKQQAGDRCQVQSDCDDGLLCVLPSGGSTQSGGTCQLPGGIQLFDMSGSVDGAAQDLSSID